MEHRGPGRLYLPFHNELRTMTDFFFSLGHFFQWTFTFIVKLNWAIPVVIIAALLFGMAFWLYTQTVLTRRAKERNEFI
jgi:hypothetical protein